MVMSGHQAVGINVEIELGLGKRDVFQELLAVAITCIYFLAIVTAGSDVVKTMFGL